MTQKSMVTLQGDYMVVAKLGWVDLEVNIFRVTFIKVY